MNALLVTICACFGIMSLASLFVRARRVYYERQVERLKAELARIRLDVRRGQR